MKRVVLVLAAVAAVALPTNAGAAQLHGVVVGKQKERGVLVVAGPKGAVWSVRTRSAARIGARVSLSGRRLEDGTFAATRVRVTGRSSRARIRGTVVGKSSGATFISAGRNLLAVRSMSRSLASIAQSGPLPGTVVQVTVTFGEGGSLTEISTVPLGTTSEIVVLASVAALTPATATTPGSVTLSVHGQTLVIPLPAGTVLPPSVVVGSTVTLRIRFSPAGPIGAPDDDTDDTDDDTDDTDDDTDDTDD